MQGSKRYQIGLITKEPENTMQMKTNALSAVYTCSRSLESHKRKRLKKKREKGKRKK